MGRLTKGLFIRTANIHPNIFLNGTLAAPSSQRTSSPESQALQVDQIADSFLPRLHPPHRIFAFVPLAAAPYKILFPRCLSIPPFPRSGGAVSHASARIPLVGVAPLEGSSAIVAAYGNLTHFVVHTNLI